MNSERCIFRQARLSAIGLLLLSVITVCGCGGSSRDQLPRASIAGTVTRDGSPLTTGVIRFVPTAGTSGPQTTAVITDGKFSLPAEQGPVVGNHRVEIESTDTGGLVMDDEQTLQAEKRPPKIRVVVVPPIYNLASQLAAIVPEGGASGLSFVLSGQSDRR